MDLKTYLTENRLTAGQFAARIGLSHTTSLYKYMAGRMPSDKFLARILVATGGQVTANDFVAVRGPSWK